MFMAALGMASATGVLVANAYGRGNKRDAMTTGWMGVGLSLTVAAALCLALFAFRADVAALYATDPALIAAASTLLSLVAVVALADGAQVVMGNAVRALGDAWIAAGLYLIAFALVMVPLGWLFAFPVGWGAEGLYYGVFLGCTISLALLAARFATLCRIRFAA
jgi:MATE family multidrug resistance protein